MTDLSTLMPANAGQNQSKELTDLQKSIADLALDDNTLTCRDIAKKLDCSPSTISKTLNKQHVREYILSQVNTELLLSSSQAMATQRKLLQSKSDYIKHQAATDILNRSEVGNSGIVLGQAVVVKIDLS